MTETSHFSAAESALGYLYQVRTALLWSLCWLKTGGDFIVSLETLDDVSFETRGGEPKELLQTKHHLNREATLTDASPDLWKSLRVWLDGHASGRIPPATRLYLLTTGRAPDGCAAARLRFDNRDVDAALRVLEATARSSKSGANAPAYRLFLNTPQAERKGLIGRVVVLDASPSISDLDVRLEEEVHWAVSRKNRAAFLDGLEGWWLRRSLKQLASGAPEDRVSATEIELQMSDLREQFKQDTLSVDKDLLTFDLDEATQTAHASSIFVRQLEIITAGKGRVAAAIRDYYRAFEQRSRWLRNDLLLVDNLTQYERRLIEEWDIVFEAMKDDLGAEPVEELKQKAAREVLIWAERTSLPIRQQITEPFITRGSFHMLADEVRLGWHPDFRDRLASVLGLKEAVG